MTITTRPGPDGRLFTHSVVGHASGQPAAHFTDSILDLSHPSDYPTVTAWEAEDGTWGVEVSVLDSNPTASPEVVAALEGGLAEVLASAMS